MSKLDNLSAWRLFCSLCNTRNFSDTAGEFDVEVSTVSRALTNLLLGAALAEGTAIFGFVVALLIILFLGQ